MTAPILTLFFGVQIISLSCLYHGTFEHPASAFPCFDLILSLHLLYSLIVIKDGDTQHLFSPFLPNDEFIQMRLQGPGRYCWRGIDPRKTTILFTRFLLMTLQVQLAAATSGMISTTIGEVPFVSIFTERSGPKNSDR